MYIDHVGINTNDMEATLQFYCGILGMQLVRTTRTPDGRRHYNVEIGGGNAFAVFDGAELPMAGERQHVNHLALPVDTLEEFDAAYRSPKNFCKSDDITSSLIHISAPASHRYASEIG